MPADLRAMPMMPASRGITGAKRDLFVRRMATCLTAFTAAVAVMIVAIIAVAFSIT
jgi:hypothetical protein